MKASILACLLAAWPLVAGSETSPGIHPTTKALSAGRTDVVQAIELSPDDPIWQWFKTQDTLLDDILTRLARVETLVGDIHRLVSAMPGIAPAPVTTQTPAATPAPVAAPAKPSTPAPAKPSTRRPPPIEEDEAAETGVVSAFLPQLAGGSLLVLLLWWMRSRRRASTQEGKPGLSSVAASAKTAQLDESSLEHATPAPAPAPVKPAAVSPAITSPSAPAAPAASAPPTAKPPVSPPSAPPSLNLDFPVESSEQVDQALELAEIMLAMGLGHGAAQTLAEQIHNEPKQALRHWLKLLEIYRKNGQQEEFERSSEELRQHFNVKPEDWHAQPDAPHSIEDYPHISARVIELWRTPACLVYLHNMLADNRGGSRAGFPQSVAEEMLLLTTILKNGSAG